MLQLRSKRLRLRGALHVPRAVPPVEEPRQPQGRDDGRDDQLVSHGGNIGRPGAADSTGSFRVGAWLAPRLGLSRDGRGAYLPLVTADAPSAAVPHDRLDDPAGRPRLDRGPSRPRHLPGARPPSRRDHRRRPLRAGAGRDRARQRGRDGDDPLPSVRRGRRDPRLPRPAPGPALVNGRAAPAGASPRTATSSSRPACFEPGENALELDFVADIAPSGASIIRTHDPTDGSDYLYTLLVPADANQLFPCFDQPDLKARVRLTLTAPAGWSVVANGSAVVGRHRRASGSRPASPQTEPISTYLIAFAAGPWRSARCDERRPHDHGLRPPLARGARPTSTPCSRSTHRALAWMERYFGRPYPFEKFDFVLAPAFPFGGMEHPGAVFYNEDGFIFRERPTLPRTARPLFDHPARGRPPVVRRPGHHAVVRRPLAQGRVRDLHGGQGAGRPRARGRRVEDVLPRQQAGGVRGGSAPRARARSGRRSTTSTRPRATTARSSTTRRRRCSSSSTISWATRRSRRACARSSSGTRTATRPGATCSARSARRPAGRSTRSAGTSCCGPGHAGGGAAARVARWDGSRGSSLTQRPAVPAASASGGSGSAAPRPCRRSGPSAPRSCSPIGTDRRCGSRSSSAARVTVVHAAAGRPAPDFVFANARDYGYFLLLLDSASVSALEGGALGRVDDAFLRAMLWGALWDQVRALRMAPERFVRLALRELPARDATSRSCPCPRPARLAPSGAYLLPGRARSRSSPTSSASCGRARRTRRAPTACARRTSTRSSVLRHRLTALARLDGPAVCRLRGGRAAPRSDPLGHRHPPARARRAERRARCTPRRSGATPRADGRRRAFIAGAGRPSAETKRDYFRR